MPTVCTASTRQPSPARPWDCWGARFKPSPDRDSVLGGQPEVVVLGDAEGIVERVDVAHHLIAPELRRGVWVDRQAADRLSWPHLALPGLCPRHEEPLIGRQTIDLDIVGPFTVCEGAAERLVGDAEAAEVADVLPDRERTVDGLAIGTLRRQVVVLGDQRAGQGVKGSAVGVGPPVVEGARAVVLRALVIEAVADLVANHGADGPVVDRVI